MIKDFFPIIQNKLIQKDIYEMIIHAPKIAKDAKCGQFIHISLGDQSMLLRRPISISQIIDDKIVICYRINGNGTKLLSEKKINEELDIIGPLGNSFPLVNNKKVLLLISHNLLSSRTIKKKSESMRNFHDRVRTYVRK